MRQMTEEQAKSFETNQQIKFVVTKFQEGMIKFEELKEQVTQVFTFLKDISLDVAMLKADHDKLSGLNQDTAKSTNESIRSLTGNIGNITQVLDRTGFAIGDINNKFGHIQGKISEINGQISQISEKNKGFALNEDVLSIKNNVKSLYEDMNNKLNTYQENQKDLLETQLHCSKSLEVVSSDLTELQKRVYITENKEKELSVNVALSKEYTSICFSKLQDNLLNYIERQIDGIPQPVIPSLDDAKKVMEEKLVPAALDAKNANLRSANNEHKILILEKKIEQLQLLLNKQQIQG